MALNILKGALIMSNILLLEDEESLSRGISFKLEKEGYNILSCSGVKKGIELFENNKIDLIICDITLEDGSGLDFCKEIRNKSDVRFIFLTAMDQEIDIVMGYEIGADDYITKPFSLAVLVSKINAISRRLQEESREKIESGEISDENTLAVNIRRLREQIESDPSKPIYIKNIRGIGYVWDKECRKIL